MAPTEFKYGEAWVDNKSIPALRATIYDASTFEATAATNGYKGGDAGHGSKTLVRIKCTGAAEFIVNPSPANYTAEVTLIVEGDAELRALIESLKFCATALESLALPKMFE